MVVCCRCNGDGKCRNCACVKANRRCTSCLPSRKGKCLNIKQPTASNPSGYIPAQIPAVTDSQPSILTLNSTSTVLPLNIQQSNQPADDHDTTNSAAHLSSSTPIRAHLAQLPPYEPTSQTPFVWGEFDSDSFSSTLSAAYLEVVHWKRNVFQIPFGKGGKEFVKELSRIHCP